MALLDALGYFQREARQKIEFIGGGRGGVDCPALGDLGRPRR